MVNTVVCPKCGEINAPKTTKCKACGYEIIPIQLKFLLDVPGVDAFIIQKIYAAGFKSADELKSANLKDIAKVEGVSKMVAERIKQHILKMILKHEFVDAEQKNALYICTRCGALLSPSTSTCPNCGAVVISDEKTTVPLEKKSVSEDEKLIRELEKPKITLFLCSNCGAFVSSEARACPNCGALMEGSAGEEEIEAKEGTSDVKLQPEITPIHEMDGAIIGVCSSCGAFLSRSAKACPVCGSSPENNISVAINSTEGESKGRETAITPAFAISGFDPKLESESKIFLCEICGAFVSEGAEVCPVCNSPTANMKREVIRIGTPEEMGSEEVINLLEKEIIRAMESGETLEAEKKTEKSEVPVEPDIVELGGFEAIENELKNTIPEHQAESGLDQVEAQEHVEHLVDVHSAVTSELGDILVESVFKERFSFEKTEPAENVPLSADPIGDVESELWEYFFDFEEEKTEDEKSDCPICGYKNLLDSEKCEICGSTILPEKDEEKEEVRAVPTSPQKVKKEVVVEDKKDQQETRYKKVRKITEETQTLPVSKVTMKPISVEKKSIWSTMTEKNYYTILAISLTGTGIVSLLVFGLTFLALGVIAASFVCIGMLFSYFILKERRKVKSIPHRIIKISEQDKPNEIALFNMGSTYLATGRFGDAVKIFEEVVKINPKNEVAWNNLGSALSKLERHEEALNCYSKALDIKPDFEIAWNNKGNALARLGRFEEAIECYDKAITLRSDYHDAWVNKGYVLVKIGRYTEAIACANEANKIAERML